MAFKLLASADLHLGRRSSELPPGEEAASSKVAWERMVEHAIREEVDAVLLSGDIVDQYNRYFEAFGPLRKGFDRLNQAGITVYMVAGNHDHDVLPQLVEHQAPANVHLIGKGGEWESIPYQEGELELIGWSFPSRYVRKDPSSDLSSLDTDPNAVTIGLLHGDLHDPESQYAPLDITHLKNGPADAWIVGHIHKPEELNSSGPVIRYPGSPQALSPKESGTHGALMLQISKNKEVQVEQIPLSPVLYETINVDLSEAEEEDQVRGELTAAVEKDAETKVQENENLKYLVYDLTLTGEHEDPNQVQEWAGGIVDDFEAEVNAGTSVRVRKVHTDLEASIGNLEVLAQERTPAGKLAKTLLALENEENTEFVDQLIEQWRERQKEAMKREVYQPLRQDGRIEEASREEAVHYLRQESRRLLRALLDQKKENE